MNRMMPSHWRWLSDGNAAMLRELICHPSTKRRDHVATGVIQNPV
jgi:hypothetical protein